MRHPPYLQSAMMSLVEWTEFVAALVGHLAWPATVVVLSILFRGVLSARLRSLLHFKGAGLEATFGNELAATEQSVGELLDAAGVPIEDPSTPRPESDGRFDPSGMIIRSWEGIVPMLDDLRLRTPSSGRPTRNVTAMLNQLRRDGVIGSGLVETISRLYELRNAVAHGKHEPTAGEALSYQESAKELAGYLIHLMTGAN